MAPTRPGMRAQPHDSAAPAAVVASLERLTATLWSEREVLRRLLFQLTVHGLVVAAREWDCLAEVDEQLDATTTLLRELEVVRAMESQRLANLLGCRQAATLAQLAADVPDPWPAMLGDHGEALRSLLGSVQKAAGRSEILVSAAALHAADCAGAQ